MLGHGSIGEWAIGQSSPPPGISFLHVSEVSESFDASNATIVFLDMVVDEIAASFSIADLGPMLFEIMHQERGSAIDRNKSEIKKSKLAPLYYPNVPEWAPTDMVAWVNQLAIAVNSLISGRINVSHPDLTLTPNSATTQLTDSRIGSLTQVTLIPLTPSAATEAWYISEQKQGSAIVNHSNAASTDRVFRLIIIG